MWLLTIKQYNSQKNIPGRDSVVRPTKLARTPGPALLKAITVTSGMMVSGASDPMV